jgi:hypothetical protein
MKTNYQAKNTKLIYYFLLSITFYACGKINCPDERTYSYKYYNIKDNIDKQTFPYQFKDTQIWINVNTNDTLHYILKDTVSSYDISSTSTTEGCRETNYKYSERLTYKFNCLEDTFFNYNYTYQSDKGFGYDRYLKFNKIEYVEYGGKLEDIDNYGIIYKDINVSKYFARIDSLGILRITVGSDKIYRIK